MNVWRLALSLVLIAAAGIGCQQRPEPDPSLTAVAGLGGSGSGDFINPQDVGGLGGEFGLEGRAAGFGADGEFIEGLLPSVYFDFDQATIRPEDRPALQQAADHLTQNPNDRLLIEGHADWRGTTEYNLALGDRRADSARQYLVSLGIAPERVEIVSKGDLEAATDASEQQMQQDRRADLIVVR